MTRSSNSQEPPKVMTWRRATPVMIIALVFDGLRTLFVFSWFFAPIIATAYCTAVVNGILTKWTVGMLGMKTAALACGASVVGIIVLITAATGNLSAGAIEVFGTVMAMATALAGWITIGLIMLMSDARIFKENSLWLAGGFIISEIPFVNALPALTVTVWRMYHKQIKTERAAFKKWEQENAAQLQEQQQQVIQIMQIRAMQQVQFEAEEAANEEIVAEQQIEEDKLSAEARFEEQEAANDKNYDDGEIPDTMPKAA